MYYRRCRHQQIASEPKEQRHDQETLTNPFEDLVRDKSGVGTMSKKELATLSTHGLLPTEVDGFDSLAELALDMRWSWNHATAGLWRALDPVFWELTHNSWVVLQTVSRDQLKSVLADPALRKNIDALLKAKRQAAETPAWFQQQHSQASLTCVAYFSMEFMLSEALPIYSGGLGNVAGDQLKAASDLGVPVVGLGLLYQ
jgi:starch phosphorylase